MFKPTIHTIKADPNDKVGKYVPPIRLKNFFKGAYVLTTDCVKETTACEGYFRTNDETCKNECYKGSVCPMWKRR